MQILRHRLIVASLGMALTVPAATLLAAPARAQMASDFITPSSML